MSQEFVTPAASQPSGSFSWIQVWTNALTRPSVATFEELVRDPKATSGRAYAWVFITALIGSGFSVLIELALAGISGSASSAESGAIATLGGSIMRLVCAVPVIAVLSVLGLMISAGITQLIASAIGGTGTYSKLVYAFAAYLAPLALITGVLGAIPYVNCLTFPLGLYSIVLNVTAVKAVHQFGWGKAVASSILILAGILVVVAVVIIVILALLGPAIGSVFSNIIRDIGTPVP